MLPKSLRLPLRTQTDFFKIARKYHSPHFVIYYKENNLKTGRGAVVIPASKVAKATDRNKYKRWLSDFLFKSLPDLNSLDLVLYLKKRPVEESLESLSLELAETLKRIDKK